MHNLVNVLHLGCDILSLAKFKYVKYTKVYQLKGMLKCFIVKIDVIKIMLFFQCHIRTRPDLIFRMWRSTGFDIITSQKSHTANLKMVLNFFNSFEYRIVVFF